MSDSYGFDHIDAASRVREVVKKLATREIGKNVPQPIVGRVMSVDLPRLRATVWFPNDDQPVEVKLLSSVIPGDWQHKQDRGDFTSLAGYGSQAVVERLNNSLYVTQVLSGGQFSFDFRTMNASIVAQKATPTTAGDTNSIEPLVGQAYETFINCQVTDTTITAGQAIDFGPFTQVNAGEPGIGAVEVTVAMQPNLAQKTYKFVVNPRAEFDHPGSTGILDSWFRILSEHSITDNSATDADFDLDISYKRTAYGNTAAYSGYPEIWFRIIKRTSDTSGLDALVTIRATNIQKGRALGGRELFMQERRTSPPEIHGYLGFHNSQHLFRDTDDVAVFDNFGRVTTNGWGTSDSGQSWVPINGLSGMFADGQSGVFRAINTSSQNIRIATSLTDFDCSWVTWVDQVAVGAEFQFAGIFRYLDNSNRYRLKIIFDLAGVVKMSFVSTTGGTSFTLGSDYTAPFTYAAGTKIRARWQVIGSLLRGKLWLDGTAEPEVWHKSLTNTDIPGGVGYGYGFEFFPGGANTNTRPSDCHVTDIKLFAFSGTLDNNQAQWHSGPWRNGPLRLANDLRWTWTRDITPISWRNNRFKFGTIYFSGVGRHRSGIYNGRANLTMPATGATIPIVTNGTVSSAVTSNDGIELLADQALYVGIPPGADWRDLNQYLFIVDSTTYRDYLLPEWAVLIAARGPSTAVPDLRLGNGDQLDSWKGLSYNNSWANAGSSASGQYRMQGLNEMKIIGRMSPGTKTNGTVIFTMPVGYRVPYIMSVPVTCNGQGTGESPHLDFMTDGTVQCWGMGTSTIVAIDVTIPLDIPS